MLNPIFKRFALIVGSLMLVLSSVASLAEVITENDVQTLIRHHKEGDWSVTYKTTHPVQQLFFSRTPDTSRVQRWQSLTNDISIEVIDGVEVIRHQNGEAFDQVSFRLTPTYIHLPKDYAPFSPYSDGGMLFHSARFFVCEQVCDAQVNAWPMTVISDQHELIIVTGDVFTERVSWVAKDSGSKIYVGQQQPQAEDEFISVVDQQLPDPLKQAMATKLPKLMDFFSKQLGVLSSRPTLFASYSDTDDGRYGYQGGTLPGQVFMHWYGEASLINAQSEATYWFFAHEVVHIFQGRAGAIEEAQEAWLHEGTAEYFAAQMVNAATRESKFNQARQACAKGLEHQQNFHTAIKQNPQLSYSCGLLMMAAIDTDIQQHDAATDLYGLWRDFIVHVEQGQSASVAGFISSAQSYVSPSMLTALKSVEQGSTDKAWQQLLLMKH